MVRQRLQEVVDFARSESPYRAANKGWITNDVFLKLGGSVDRSLREEDEMASVSVLWGPINQIALIFISVLFAASIFVFSMVSLAHGNFSISPLVSDVISEAGSSEVKLNNSSEDSLKSVEAQSVDLGSNPVKQNELSQPEKRLENTKEVARSSSDRKLASAEPEKRLESTKEVTSSPSERNLVTAVDMFQPKRPVKPY